MASAMRNGKVARARPRAMPRASGRPTGPAQRQRRRPAVKRRSATARYGVFLVVGFLVAAAATAAPAAIAITLCGMLPTLVVVALDWSEGRSIACCVGCMNLAGVFPFLPALWSRGATFVSPASLFGDTTALIVMYAAAAAGWLLVALLPALFVMLEREGAHQRIAQLRDIQKKLEDEWSEAVAAAGKASDPEIEVTAG